MKTKIIIITLAMLALASISGRAATIGTEFTYQGRLTDTNGPPNGSYDFTFTLYLAASGGSPIVTVTNLNAAVSNGLFTATVDFGGGIYNGNAYWISLGVCSNGAGGSFTVLTPRQPLTPTPNASYASLAGTVSGGSITSAKLAVDSVSNLALQSNAVTADKVAAGQLVKSLNGLRDDVLLSAGPNLTITPSGNTLTIAGSSGWNLGGNAGTTAGVDFVGTTDNQSLVMKVNNTQALRVEPATNNVGAIFPNMIGGVFNSVAAGQYGSTIAGGRENGIFSTHAAIAGGWRNQIQAGSDDSAIAGGQANVIQANASFSTIGAGAIHNIGAGATSSTIGGGYYNRIGDSSINTTISGGRENVIQLNASSSTIGGGFLNTVQSNAFDSIISGGEQNTIESAASSSTIGGGYNNRILSNAHESTIGGGYLNMIQPEANSSTIGGGVQNIIQPGAWYSTIGGGGLNTVKTNGHYSVIGGGEGNTSGSHGAVPGGYHNSADGIYSFAAGFRAKAIHGGSFVWADSFTDQDYLSTANDQFCVRAAGGLQLSSYTGLYCGTTTRQMLNLWGTQYGIGVQASTLYFRCDNADPNNGFIWYRGGVHDDGYANPGAGGTEMMHLVSAGLYVNGAIVLTSDRNAKENFTLVSPREVLEKVAALPISRWNFKEDKASEHLGPMAQDFRAAFGLGPDDKHITTVDADGVALAAIQGLNQKLNEKDAEIQSLKQQNDSLAERLNELEAAVKSLVEKK